MCGLEQKRDLYKSQIQNWNIYNKKNSSLPSNIITKITKDEYNRIWVGTTKGIVSYNGFEWKRYCKQKKINTIFNIYIDKSDNKWISTEDNSYSF